MYADSFISESPLFSPLLVSIELDVLKMPLAETSDISPHVILLPDTL